MKKTEIIHIIKQPLNNEVMNVKKYLTVLAGAALLSACTSDEPANGPDVGSGGQVGTAGTVTFKIDGLAGGSTSQPTKAGETIIASSKENEIQVLDILVFAYCNDNNTVTTVGGTTSNINDPAYWKLQEWHYYTAGEITDTADPFYRPTPSTTAGSENKFHRFQLQGSGAYRVATISPAIGLATNSPSDNKRYLRFFMVANAAMDKTLFGNDAFLDGGSPKSLQEIINGNLNLFAKGTALECPLPMVGSLKPEGDADYITAADATKSFTISAILKRAVARFDIVNLTPGDFTLTKIETPKPADGKVNFTTLHPTGYEAAGNVTINLPTLDKLDENSTPYWTAYGTDAMAFNSAFYTTPSAATGDAATTSEQKMTLTVYGTNGLQETSKTVDLVTVESSTSYYDINPNTRYRLLISYYGGIQATMEVMEWKDDLLNPDLSTGEKPILKVPANNLTSETPDLETGIRPYTGWFWEDRSAAGTIPEEAASYIATLPLTDLTAARELRFDIAVDRETDEFPFAFRIVNALHPNQPDNVWLREHTYGATQDATDKKLWHVKLVAKEGAVNNLATLDPLKIRIYSKVNPEFYTFIDVLKPTDNPGLFISWTANGSTTPVWGNSPVVITDQTQTLELTYPNALGGYKISADVSSGTINFSGLSTPISSDSNAFKRISAGSHNLDITFENLPDKIIRYKIIINESPQTE